MSGGSKIGPTPLAAWCEQREGFRNLRVDRIEVLAENEDRFLDEQGRALADLLHARCGDKERPRT